MSVWVRGLLIVSACALFAGGRAVFAVLYALLALGLTFRQGVKGALARLHVSQRPSAEGLFPGERAQLVLSLQNPSRFPLPWLVVEAALPEGLAARGPRRAALALAGRSQATLSFTIEARARGVHTIGPLKLETGDPLGATAFKAEAAKAATVIVYPRVHPVDTLPMPGRAITGTLPAPRRGLVDPTRLAGVRDFQPGDSVRHIHWRATAHTGSLKVKRFETMRSLSVIVLLDLVRERYRSWNQTRMSELAVEVAASLLYAAAQSRTAFGFFAAARGVVPLKSGIGKGDAHLRRSLELLAAVAVRDEPCSIERLADAALREVSREATLYLVTPQLQAQGRGALERLIMAGYNVVVLEVCDDDQAQRPQFPRGAGYLRIAHGADLAHLGASLGQSLYSRSVST